MTDIDWFDMADKALLDTGYTLEFIDGIMMKREEDENGSSSKE